MSVRVIDAVFRWSRSTGAARLVLLALADVASDDGEVTAYARSQSTLMAKAAVSKGTVRRSIDALVALGEVEVLSIGDGRTRSDYRIRLDAFTNEGVQDGPPQDGPPGGAGSTPREGEIDPLGVQDGPPITPSRSVASPSPSIAAEFETFWARYPRHTARRSAEQAWPRAVKRAGGVAPILAGCERYRNDPNREDGFTAHAATWLNGDRWNDDPLPARALKPNRIDQRLGQLAAQRPGRPDLRRAVGDGS